MGKTSWATVEGPISEPAATKLSSRSAAAWRTGSAFEILTSDFCLLTSDF